MLNLDNYIPACTNKRAFSTFFWHSIRRILDVVILIGFDSTSYIGIRLTNILKFLTSVDLFVSGSDKFLMRLSELSLQGRSQFEIKLIKLGKISYLSTSCIQFSSVARIKIGVNKIYLFLQYFRGREFRMSQLSDSHP